MSPVGHGSAGVHLPRAAPWRNADAVRVGRGQQDGRVEASAVDHDDLVAGGAQWLQRDECADDSARLVQRRNDDRNAHERRAGPLLRVGARKTRTQLDNVASGSFQDGV